MSIQIVFFGTGSGRPMPHRNVSGMALTRDGETYVFDCGEGTQIQLMHTPVRVGNIEAILLSHFHGDHVNGLPGFLGSLSLNRRESKLPVYAPEGLKMWFETMHRLHILRADRFVSLREIDKGGVVVDCTDYQIIAQPLKHRVPCYGYAFVEKPRLGRFNLERARELNIPPGPLYGRLQRGESVTLEDGRTVLPEDVVGEARPGLKVVYCTDTQPCDATVELAKDADLLIHESTYPAGMEREAHQRGHSTAADAATIACRANVKRLVLTHFSQRFYSTKEFVDGAQKIFPNTEAAADLAEFTVSHPN